MPTHRPNASAPYSPRAAFHPMMNGVGGTSLHYWAQSWRLNPWDFKVVSETTTRYGASRIPPGLHGRRLAVRRRGTRALLRHRRARARRVGQGRQHQRQDRSRAATSSRRRAGASIRCRRCAGPIGTRRWRRPRAASDGIRFPGPRRSTRSTYEGRPGCAYHGFCARGGCHVNAKGSTAVTTIPKAQKTGRLDVVTEAHVTEVERRRQRPRHRRHVRQRARRFLPAGERRAAGELHLRERADAAALEIEGVSERPVEQPRAGRAALLHPRHRRQRARRCSR